VIAERKRVAEILALRVKAKRGPWQVDRQGIGYLGISMSFQETLIDSDTRCITLMDRVHTYFNAQWKRNVISFQQLPETCGDKFPEASVQDMRIQTELCGRHWPEADRDIRIANYRDMWIENWRKQILMRFKDAEGHLTTTLEKLVVMQVLCEVLKPETRDLIKRCSSPEQLDMLMLTIKKSPTQGSSNGLLLPSIRKRQEGLVELVEPETEIASGKKLFPLKDLEGIIDRFRTQIERNNFAKSFPLASFYDREKVAFLEPIFNLFKDIQGRLEVLEKRS
jgi:hypothetical protein